MPDNPQIRYRPYLVELRLADDSVIEVEVETETRGKAVTMAEVMVRVDGYEGAVATAVIERVEVFARCCRCNRHIFRGEPSRAVGKSGEHRCDTCSTFRRQAHTSD